MVVHTGLMAVKMRMLKIHFHLYHEKMFVHTDQQQAELNKSAVVTGLFQ